MENNVTMDSRKRKAFLVMPLLVIPFLTMAFWAMGGGKGEVKDQKSQSGLNLQLPGAHLKEEKDVNKMSFYDQAEKEAAKSREQQKNDPLYQNTSIAKDSSLFGLNEQPTSLSFDPYQINGKSYKDPNEEKVYKKLNQLNEQLHRSTSSYNPSFHQEKRSSGMRTEKLENENPINPLVSESSSEDHDSDLTHLNNMMDKILDIQHPERISNRRKETSMKNKMNAYPVTTDQGPSTITLLDTSRKIEKAGTGFYGLEQNPNEEEDNGIQAVVHENQTLVNGAILKLRLMDDIYIAGQRIPKGNFIYGTTSLNGERLEVAISSVRMNHSVFPVQLIVYDLDGIPGISIPGAITRDVAKSSLDNATQLLEVTSLDPSLKAQAASAGISAAKNLISKKVKLVKVVVKAGYKVLLKSKNVE